MLDTNVREWTVGRTEEQFQAEGTAGADAGSGRGSG